MKLHDLTVGQRFSFIGKHRGKVFEVIDKRGFGLLPFVQYKDVADQKERTAWSDGKTFRFDVELITSNRVVELTPNQVDKLHWILYVAYTAVETQEARNEINELHILLTGVEGRRVIKPGE